MVEYRTINVEEVFGREYSMSSPGLSMGHGRVVQLVTKEGSIYTSDEYGNVLLLTAGVATRFHTLPNTSEVLVIGIQFVLSLEDFVDKWRAINMAVEVYKDLAASIRITGLLSSKLGWNQPAADGYCVEVVHTLTEKDVDHMKEKGYRELLVTFTFHSPIDDYGNSITR